MLTGHVFGPVQTLDSKHFQISGYVAPGSPFLLEAFLLRSPSEGAKGVQRAGELVSVKPVKEDPQRPCYDLDLKCSTKTMS